MTLEYNPNEGDKNKQPERQLPVRRQPPESSLPLLGRPPSLAEEFQNYYMNPDTLRLRRLFREAWEANLFKLKNGRINPITPTFFAAALDAAGESAWEGFIDEVLNYEVKAVSWWDKNIRKKATPQERLNALSIIAFLSVAPEKRPLRYFLKRTLAPDQDINQQLAEAEKQLAFYRPAEILYNPLQLDQLWAQFYATGAVAPIHRVIAVANGQDIASPEEVQQRSGFRYELIYNGAAYSLVTLARKQERVAHIIYDSLEDYTDQPVYVVLLAALKAANIIEDFEARPDSNFDIKWRVPPDWL